MEKSFRVPILIQVRVVGEDYADAANIAEAIIKQTLLEGADPLETEAEGKPALVIAKGYVYKGILESTPQELNRAVRNGTGPLFVYGKISG